MATFLQYKATQFAYPEMDYVRIFNIFKIYAYIIKRYYLIYVSVEFYKKLKHSNTKLNFLLINSNLINKSNN
jgi:hypothetical protein